MTTALQSLPRWEAATRGGGLVARDSHVSKRAYVAPAAIVRSGAEIFGQARAEGTTEVGRLARLSGKAIVRNSRILDFSAVSDSAQVINSTLSADAGQRDCPFVCDEAVVEDSHLYGQVRVCENGSLKNVTADGNVEIRGNGRAEDCELGSGVIIHEGIWHESPRVWLTGLHYNLIACRQHEDWQQSKCIVGCVCHTVDHWIRGGRKNGQLMGMTDEQMWVFAQLIIENFVPAEYRKEAYSIW